MELKFQIPFISGIPDSLSCIRDSKAKDLGFYLQKFPSFWIEKKKKKLSGFQRPFPLPRANKWIAKTQWAGDISGSHSA